MSKNLPPTVATYSSSLIKFSEDRSKVDNLAKSSSSGIRILSVLIC